MRVLCREIEKIGAGRSGEFAGFRQKCQEIVQGLSEQYQAMFPETSAKGLSEDEASKRKKDLVFDLNTSGKYLQLKDSLRESVVRIVKEKYRRTGHMTHEELQGIYNDVYMYLVDEMHLALAGLFGPKAEATAALPDSPPARSAEPGRRV